jgi:rubrerythrin
MAADAVSGRRVIRQRDGFAERAVEDSVALRAEDGGLGGRLADGTPYVGRIGELAYDPDEDKVQCHLCGGWYRLLGSTHLLWHGWTLAGYREAFRIPRNVPTCSRTKSELHRAQSIERGDAEIRLAPNRRPVTPQERQWLPRWRSLAARHPELLAELHPTRNAELDPYTVGSGSTQRLWWRCRACGHEWESAAATRSAGSGCPQCAQAKRSVASRSVPRERSLAARRPELLALLHPTRNEGLDPWSTATQSAQRLWWRCPACAHEWQATPAAAGCARCAAARHSERMQRVERERSLAVRRPDLLASWHPTRNGTLDPWAIAPSAKRRVWWQCPACGHEWQSTADRRGGCPECVPSPRHRNVDPTRSLPALRPDLVAELHPTRNGKLVPATVSGNSYRRLWWRCARCAAECCQSVHDRARRGCPTCAARAPALAEAHPELLGELHRTRNAPLEAGTLRMSDPRHLWWRCQRCGHEWRTSAASRARGNGCPRCARQDEKRAATAAVRARSLAARHPELLAELHPTRSTHLDPEVLSARSTTKVWWQCSQCAHEWQTAPQQRSNGHGCPRCAAQANLQKLKQSSRERAAQARARGTLALTRPDLRAQLHPTRNGQLDLDAVQRWSWEALWWQCPDCGHQWRTSPATRARKPGSRCPACVRRTTKPPVRAPAVTSEKLARALELRATGRMTIAEIAAALKVSRSALYRALRTAATDDTPRRG